MATVTQQAATASSSSTADSAIASNSIQLTHQLFDHPLVTDSIRAQYLTRGFVKIEGAIDEAAQAAIAAAAERMVLEARKTIADAMQRGVDPAMIPKHVDATKLVVVPEASNPEQVCRVEDMMRCYPDFAAAVCPAVVPLAEALLGEAMVAFKDKLNFKWPGGGGFAPHQDHPAYWAFPPKHFLTAMVCIDDATVENGCVQFPAGSYHKAFQNDAAVDQDALAAGRAVLPYDKGGMTKDASDKIVWEPATARKCDLVLFDSFVPHYSEANMSTKPRRAIFFTMNRAAEGDHYSSYYNAKRSDPANPQFHFATPTARHGDMQSMDMAPTMPVHMSMA